MALWQGTSRRKPSGGRLRPTRHKRRREVAREEVNTFVGTHKQKPVRGRAGTQKVALLATDRINITDPATGKTEPATIKTVVENPANIHYVRRNILTKGAVVETDKGRARVTSRPGQTGVLSGVLLK